MNPKSVRTRKSSGRASHDRSGDPISAAKTRKEVNATPLRTAAIEPQRSDDGVFDPGVFLSAAGLDREPVKLKKKEILYAQGAPANHIYYAQSGRMRVTVIAASGKEATIAIVGPGDFIGESCMLLGHSVRLETAIAMSESLLLRVSSRAMARALRRESTLSEIFVSFLLTRNARIQADLVDQLFNSSEKRLARILLLLARFWQSRATGSSSAWGQPSTAGRHDWNYSAQSEFFYEPFQEVWFH